MMRLNGGRSEMDKFFQQLVQIFLKSLTLSGSGSKSTGSTKTSKQDFKKRQKKRLKKHASELKI